MSYGIQRTTRPAADADKLLVKYYKVIPHFIIKNWAITQDQTVEEQLKHGVRYFDLRLVVNSKETQDEKFYFTHAVFSQEITGPLVKVNEFLNNHPKEFIILDCHRIIGLENDQHTELMDKLEAIFGANLLSADNNTLTSCTLNEMHRVGKRALIIYRHAQVQSKFWPNYQWPFAWVQTHKTREIKTYMEAELKKRRPYTGFITQLILAPTFVERIYTNLRDSCAKKVLKELSDWIEQQTPGVFEIDDAPTSNIFIADFVNLEEWKFCKMIINLNRKILNTEQSA